jgi:hypothetical protein
MLFSLVSKMEDDKDDNLEIKQYTLNSWHLDYI